MYNSFDFLVRIHIRAEIVCLFIFLKMFTFCSKLFLNLLFLILSPLLLLLLPIYAFRYFVSKVVIRCYPGIDKLLTTRSTIIGVDSIYKRPNGNIVTFLIAEGTLDLEVFRELWSRRVIEAKDRNGGQGRPEFKQYVTRRLGFLFWKWEKNFDLKSHIRDYDGKYAVGFRTGAKALNTLTSQDVMDELIYKPFQPKTSPWEILLMHNYQELDPMTGEPVGPICTAVICRFHHALADGFSFLKCILDLTEAKGQEKDEKGMSRGGSRTLTYLFSALYDVLAMGVGKDVNSWHLPENRLTRTLNTAISHQIPLSNLKDVKDVNKATFTALILGCYAAAIRRFMSEAGYKVPDVVHLGMPLPFPGHPDKMRNHATAIITTLPVGEPDSKKRLDTIEQNLLDLKGSSAPATVFQTGPVFGGLFSWMIRPFAKNDRTTAIMSNGIGPTTAISINEHTVRSMWIGGGLTRGNCGMGFLSVSYNGFLRIHIGIDEGLVPKSTLPASLLVKYFIDELDLLKKEATV